MGPRIDGPVTPIARTTLASGSEPRRRGVRGRIRGFGVEQGAPSGATSSPTAVGGGRLADRDAVRHRGRSVLGLDAPGPGSRYGDLPPPFAYDRDLRAGRHRHRPRQRVRRGREPVDRHLDARPVLFLAFEPQRPGQSGQQPRHVLFDGNDRGVRGHVRGGPYRHGHDLRVVLRLSVPVRRTG